MKIKKFLRRTAKMFMLACAMSMYFVFGTVTLPTNPSTSSATVGKDYLLSVNTGTVGTPVWTLIGGQRSSDLSRKAASIDATHKTSGGWTTTLPGLRSWSIDLSGLVLLQDPGLQALEQAFNYGLQVNIQLMYPDGTVQTGWASITDFSNTNPHDGAATLKGTLEGVGAITDRVPSVSPLSVTVSKAAATDQTFTIAPSTTTVSAVKNGGTALTVTTNYTYTAGALVIKGTYLGGLTVGVQSLAVTTGDGATLAFSVNLTA
jgi:TP901-1 family phage major tail protein